MKSTFTFLFLLFISIGASAQYVGCADGTENPPIHDNQIELDVLQLINDLRNSLGRPSLAWSEQLARASRYHAQDIAEEGYFEHASYDGGPGGACPTAAQAGTDLQCTRDHRIKLFYLGTGVITEENLGAGFDNADSLVNGLQGWAFSNQHRLTMVNNNFTEAGVGYYEKPGTSCTYYYVVNFGSRDSIINNVPERKQVVNYELTEAWPNPFNNTSKFSLKLQHTQDVHIEVLNVIGQRMAVLHDGPLTARQQYNFTIDGNQLPDGIYFYQVKGATFSEVRKVVVRRN